jgi:DNA-binding MarR family transcriptional regulator
LAKALYRVDSFDSQHSLGYLIRRLHVQLVPRAEGLFGDADLTFTQWCVLMALRDGIADTCGEISRHLGHDTGATTRLIDQMEERGLIARTRSTEDRRVVHLAITAAGKALAKTLTPRIVDFWNETLSGFTAEEFSQLLSLLMRLTNRIEAQPVESATVKPKVAK